MSEARYFSPDISVSNFILESSHLSFHHGLVEQLGFSTERRVIRLQICTLGSLKADMIRFLRSCMYKRCTVINSV